jgi:hypothetical protein
LPEPRKDDILPAAKKRLYRSQEKTTFYLRPRRGYTGAKKRRHFTCGQEVAMQRLRKDDILTVAKRKLYTAGAKKRRQFNCGQEEAIQGPRKSDILPLARRYSSYAEAKKRRHFTCGQEEAIQWEALHGVALAVGLRYQARHATLIREIKNDNQNKV